MNGPVEEPVDDLMENVAQEPAGPTGRPKRPLLTYGLIAANVAVYGILMVLAGFNTDTYGSLLMTYGAKVNGQIIAGQPWRLVSSMFFHGGLVHLLINCFSLRAVGSIVETLYGRRWFLAIYGVSGLAGSLASFCFSPYPAVGASGAIFGLLGALLYLGVLDPQFIKKGFGADILGMAVLNLAYGFTASGIDNFAHMGGLAGGFLMTGVLMKAVARIRINTKVLSAAALLTLLCGTAWYGWHKPLNLEQSYIATLMEMEAERDWEAMQVYGIGRLGDLSPDSAARGDILYYVARSAAVQGDYAVAERYASELAQVEPGFGNYLLALVSFDQGKDTEGMAALDRAEAAGYDAARIAAVREEMSGRGTP